MVECNLAKVEVAGSNPVSRSKFAQGHPASERSGWPFYMSPSRFWNTMAKTKPTPQKASSPAPLWPDAGLDELLDLASRKYSLEFEAVSAGGVSLDVLQVADMRERLDAAIAANALQDALATLPLWAKIWPASVILGHMLRHLPKGDARILEVGGGCGLSGLVAAALGLGKVCITDINDDALLFARINIHKNGLEQ